MGSLLAKYLEKNRKASQNDTTPGEICLLAKKVDNAVCNFLTDQGLATIGERHTTINSDLGDSLEGLMIDAEGGVSAAFEGLMKAADVPACHTVAATATILQTIDRYVANGDNGKTLLNQHDAMPAAMNDNRGLTTVDELMDPAMAALFVGNEGFGIDTDSVAADLRLALDVNLLKFHASVAGHMYQIRPTDEPVAVYKTQRAEVLDLHDATATPTSVVDLYADPTSVANELKDILPLLANAAGSEIIADGILAFDKDASLLQLSIDATRPGYETINNTDLVADGVKVATVLVTISVDESSGGAADEFEETFAVDVPIDRSALTRQTNSPDSADRMLSVRFANFMTDGGLTSAGGASTLLAACSDGTEGLIVTCNLSANINLKTGVMFAQCAPSWEEHSTTGSALSSNLTDMLARILTITNNGYEVSAKFSEANFRKSDIAIRTSVAQLAIAIPPGRKYFIESEIGQKPDDRNAAILTNVIRIGEDSVVLSLIENTLDGVASAVTNDANNVEALEVFARRFPAGGRIRPAVFTGTMDFTSISSLTDADRSGEIIARTLMYLTKACADLAANSYITQQLNGNRPHYRMVTSNTILDAIVGQPHIYQHLDPKGTTPSDVEYTLRLPNGTTIEVVTTTFTSMATKMLLVPVVPNAPESELNGGHLWDHGTVVTTYQHSTGHAAVDRTVGSARQLPLPTCPIGAIINVAGIDVATFTD